MLTKLSLSNQFIELLRFDNNVMVIWLKLSIFNSPHSAIQLEHDMSDHRICDNFDLDNFVNFHNF
jgi:hypothetical protein